METTSSRKQANAEQVDLGGLTPSYIYSKRCFDFLASLIGLILLSCVFLIIGILIKVDDPHGKIFYSPVYNSSATP
ncbi:hypothetical protein ACX51_15770 [Lacticaseibacillus paracasei]|uniref:Uncharacterized protein n=1 Tax=Lacticaseibacillus paracasei TaxID=1597 RepID=A0ABD6VWU5_LACPA|nr:hypothetical protein ACX51_15770 [Lacticaseibacillus paracasei]